jgi:transposase
MARSLALAQHFSSAELLQRYRSVADPVERTHWQVVYLKSLGKATAEISQTVGYSADWVLKLIRRYNEQGERGLLDHRHEHPGSQPMLSQQQQAELARALEGKAPDGGPWTGPKVARWIAERTGRDHVHDQRGWDYLLRLGFTAPTPRPSHRQASPEEQAAFKTHAAPTG